MGFDTQSSNSAGYSDTLARGRDSSGSIVTGTRDEQSRNRASIPGSGERDI